MSIRAAAGVVTAEHDDPKVISAAANATWLDFDVTAALTIDDTVPITLASFASDTVALRQLGELWRVGATEARSDNSPLRPGLERRKRRRPPGSAVPEKARARAARYQEQFPSRIGEVAKGRPTPQSLTPAMRAGPHITPAP